MVRWEVRRRWQVVIVTRRVKVCGRSLGPAKMRRSRSIQTANVPAHMNWTVRRHSHWHNSSWRSHLKKNKFFEIRKIKTYLSYMTVNRPIRPKRDHSVSWMIRSIRRVRFLTIFHINVHDLKIFKYKLPRCL